MGTVGTIWTAFKAGIILQLATRIAARLDKAGDFAVSFILLLCFGLILAGVQHEFLVALPSRLSQFDLLRQIVMGIVGFIVLFVSYVLSAQIGEWFDTNYMNGPYVIELVIIVAMVIFIFTVAGLLLTHNTSPRLKDVEHALRIANIASAS